VPLQGGGARSEDPNSVVLQQFAKSRPTRDPPPQPLRRRSGATPTAGSTSSSPASGTGGTITGVGEVLKARKPSVKIVRWNLTLRRCFPAARPARTSCRASAPAFVPPVLNTKIYDEVIRVKDADSGPVSKQVNQLDGIPIGISSGAATWAALQLAKRPENAGKLIVAIAPSSSERYLSTWLFADIGADSDNIEDLIPASTAAVPADQPNGRPASQSPYEFGSIPNPRLGGPAGYGHSAPC